MDSPTSSKSKSKHALDTSGPTSTSLLNVGLQSGYVGEIFEAKRKNYIKPTDSEYRKHAKLGGSKDLLFMTKPAPDESQSGPAPSNSKFSNLKISPSTTSITSKESLVSEDTEYLKIARKGGSRATLLSQDNLRTRTEEQVDHSQRMERLQAGVNPDKKGRPAPYSSGPAAMNDLIIKPRATLRPIPGDERFSAPPPVTVSASEERKLHVAKFRDQTAPYKVVDSLHSWQRASEDPAKKPTVEEKLKGRT